MSHLTAHEYDGVGVVLLVVVGHVHSLHLGVHGLAELEAVAPNIEAFQQFSAVFDFLLDNIVVSAQVDDWTQC